MPAIFSPRLRLPIDLFVSSQQSSPNVHNLNLGTRTKIAPAPTCIGIPYPFVVVFFAQTRTLDLWVFAHPVADKRRYDVSRPSFQCTYI